MIQASRVPIVGLFGNLIVSVQGGLTDGQVEQLREDVTGAIESRSPRGLIVDLSGVEILDSYLTRAIRDIALTARLMGVRTAVCGLRPAVAIALVEMDLEIPGVVTALNLERAVEMLAPAQDDELPEELVNEVPNEEPS